MNMRDLRNLALAARALGLAAPLPLYDAGYILSIATTMSAGIITCDEARALAMARKLETGMCHVNCSSVNDEPHVPFGGSKASGLGRHGGRWSVETFTETRWITLDRGGRPFPPVF